MLTQAIINITAAIRILTAKLGQFGRLVVVEKITRVRGRIYNVVYQFSAKGKITRCAHFLSVTQFEKSFQESRQAKSSKLVVSEVVGASWEYKVSNPEKGTSYKVETRHPYIPCTCPDYARQRVKNFQQNSICKHGYAVLKTLGFSSLKDYVTRYTGMNDVEIDEAIEYQYEAWQDARACLGY